MPFKICLKSIFIQGKLGCIFFTLSLFGTLVAFSTGPPNTAEVCQHMFPGHGVNAQMSTPPFEIKLSRKTYVRGGEKIGGVFLFILK